MWLIPDLICDLSDGAIARFWSKFFWLNSIPSISKNLILCPGFILGDRENVVPWGFMLANNLVFKKVRGALGLDRCKNCYTGAAPITKETLEYFMSLNIPLMEVYGMSESSGPHTVSLTNDFRIMRSAVKHRTTHQTVYRQIYW